uniref:Uncharacterized protein n=1 Tax=Ascaris lumbricoides TaxID=6252 RepID=A0A0M3HXF6_ASCLU
MKFVKNMSSNYCLLLKHPEINNRRIWVTYIQRSTATISNIRVEDRWGLLFHIRGAHKECYQLRKCAIMLDQDRFKEKRQQENERDNKQEKEREEKPTREKEKKKL